tara:strand:+ start:1526 stop:3649 length:2124 start_codon:yes stop_codon:yes gene_type:complete
MARVNKWKQFGDAFNAVYDAGNTFGSAIETGKIVLKDYEDEEGQELTGLARDRAQMDDYAAVELKYGDPMEALRMRTGIETLGQNRLKTDYETDTYDERVKQGGVLTTQNMESVISARGAAAGLNRANTNRIRLGTDIRRASKDSEISANTTKYGMETARDAGLTKAYEDDSYVAALLAGQNQEEAEATLATSTAKLQNTVITDPIYGADYLKAEKARMGKIATIAQIEQQIANDPQTLEKANANLTSQLNAAQTAVANSATDLQLANTQDYQDNRLQTGLSNAEAAAKSAQEAAILAEQSLAANTFIREWGKTANPDDPTSMRNLVAGLTRINPAVGMKLSQEYGEHELWDMTNRALRMRAETNQALQTKGAAGAQEILDKYNGDALGIKVIKNDDGSMSMVETRAGGPGGQKTEVVRTIATGKDEKEFMQDLNAALDPASLMEYSMNLADIEYKRALTKFSNAQAEAAAAGKPLSAQDAAYRTMMDPEATAADKQLATMFLFRDNPELANQAMESMRLDGLIKGGQDGAVPDKLAPSVDVSGKKTPEEQKLAESVMSTLTAPGATSKQRQELLSGDNKKLMEKYFPDILKLEQNKNEAAKTLENIIKDGPKFNADRLEQTITSFETAAEKSNLRRAARASLKATAASLRDDPASVLQIVLSNLNSQLRNEDAAGRAGLNAKQSNDVIRKQAAQLEALIAELTADR